MSMQGVGAGFFYGPFTSTQVFGLYTPATTIIPFQYGAWSHLAAPPPTKRARWITMVVSPGSAPPIATYNLQLGLGTAGNEVLWQPSDGNFFYIDWLTPFATGGYVTPFVMSFPVSLIPGTEISCRVASSPAPAGQLNVFLYVFN